MNMVDPQATGGNKKRATTQEENSLCLRPNKLQK